MRKLEAQRDIVMCLIQTTKDDGFRGCNQDFTMLDYKLNDMCIHTEIFTFLLKESTQTGFLCMIEIYYQEIRKCTVTQKISLRTL